MTDNNISFLGKNNKNNDKKNVSDKNINSDTIENISNKNTVLEYLRQNHNFKCCCKIKTDSDRSKLSSAGIT